jgi:hypothetical protein
MDDIDRIKSVSMETHVHINIELGTKLLLEIEDVNMPVNSIFVGLKANEYFIASQPSSYSMIKHKLFRGNPMVIKYLHNGTVYAFPTKIIEIIDKPVQLILFLYPKFLQSQSIRSYRRNDCLIPAKIMMNGLEREGIIKDLSEEGCGCSFKYHVNQKYRLKTGAGITLYCQFPGKEGNIELTGVIQNIRKEGANEIIGIKFENLSDLSNTIIYDYLLFITSHQP